MCEPRSGRVHTGEVGGGERRSILSRMKLQHWWAPWVCVASWGLVACGASSKGSASGQGGAGGSSNAGAGAGGVTATGGSAGSSGGAGRGGSGGTAGIEIGVGGSSGSSGVSDCFEPSGAPGTLDATFGDGGTSRVQNPDSQDGQILQDLAADGEGRLLVLGLDHAEMVLYRLDADGSLDTSFGTDGFVIAATDTGNVLALDADGNVLAGGSDGSDAWVQRFTRDGTPDPTFGDAGRVTLDFGTGNDRMLAVLVQSNGSIVAAGSSDTNGPETATFVVSLAPDGTPLTDSGSVGPLRPSDRRYYPVALAELPDHALLVLGSSSPSSGGAGYPFLAKLGADGALATDFGDGGILELGDTVGPVVGIGRGADGSVLSFQFGPKLALFAYDDSGEKTPFSAVSPVSPLGVTLDCAGNVLVAGTLTNNDLNAGGLERFSPSGTTDLTFGDNGIARYEVDGAHAALERVVVLPSGAIVAGGSTQGSFVVQRYLP